MHGIDKKKVCPRASGVQRGHTQKLNHGKSPGIRDLNVVVFHIARSWSKATPRPVSVASFMFRTCLLRAIPETQRNAACFVGLLLVALLLHFERSISRSRAFATMMNPGHANLPSLPAGLSGLPLIPLRFRECRAAPCRSSLPESAQGHHGGNSCTASLAGVRADVYNARCSKEKPRCKNTKLKQVLCMKNSCPLGASPPLRSDTHCIGASELCNGFGLHCQIKVEFNRLPIINFGLFDYLLLGIL